MKAALICLAALAMLLGVRSHAARRARAEWWCI